MAKSIEITTGFRFLFMATCIRLLLVILLFVSHDNESAKTVKKEVIDNELENAKSVLSKCMSGIEKFHELQNS